MYIVYSLNMYMYMYSWYTCHLLVHLQTELLEQRTLQLQQQQSAVTSQPPPLIQAPPTTAPPCLVPVQPPSSQQKPVAAPPTQTAAIASRLGLSQAGGVVGGVATDTSIAQGASVAMKASVLYIQCIANTFMQIYKHTHTHTHTYTHIIYIASHWPSITSPECSHHSG